MEELKSRSQIKRETLYANIKERWALLYKPGETQKTPVAESIAEEFETSLSTVNRIVGNIKGK